MVPGRVSRAKPPHNQRRVCLPGETQFVTVLSLGFGRFRSFLLVNFVYHEQLSLQPPRSSESVNLATYLDSQFHI